MCADQSAVEQGHAPDIETAWSYWLSVCADQFAVEQGHAEPLKEALLILDQKNRSSTNVDPWYSAYHHSHPPLVQRLGAIEGLGKKAQ